MIREITPRMWLTAAIILFAAWLFLSGAFIAGGPS